MSDEKSAYGVLGLAIGSCAFAIGAAVTTYVWTKLEARKFDRPKQELLDLLKDESNVIKLSNAHEKMTPILKIGLDVQLKLEQEKSGKSEKKSSDKDKSSSGKDSTSALVMFHDPSESELAKKVETVTGARDGGKLPILKDTRATLDRATNLHVNKTEDFHCNPLLLSAAPLPAQFADHWELIWKEKIGVIVWVGRLVVENDVQMESYIPMKKGEQLTFGPCTVVTKHTFHRIQKFYVYEMVVTNGGQNRPLVVVHAYDWLQESVSWALRREVEVIIQIKDAHIEQLKMGVPGIMFQCKWGTAGSCSLAATYIGFQMWLHCSKVNLNGIIKYIRRCRWKAFEETGDPNHSFHVQVKVAYAVVYGLATFIETRRLAQTDEWLKKTLNPP